MKLIPIFLTTFILSSFSFASGPTAVYAILSEVQINKAKDEMVLIGKFKIAEDVSATKFSKATTGFMFYHSIRSENVMKEFQAIAKTGKCISYGDTLRKNGTVRGPKSPLANPDTFPYRGSGQITLDPVKNKFQFDKYCSDLK